MKKQKETVKWVLAAPSRLRQLIGEGKRKQAERDWDDVKRLLGRWEAAGVEGAKMVREQCVEVMAEGVESHEAKS